MTTKASRECGAPTRADQPTPRAPHTKVTVEPSDSSDLCVARAEVRVKNGRTESIGASAGLTCAPGKNGSVDLDLLPGFATPGPLRERLSGLVLAGAKTATFDLYDSARLDPAGVPAPGSHWTMHDSTDRPLAVLRTETVEILRLAEVTFAMADLEGESFISAESWRRAHEDYWAPFVEQLRAQTDDPAWSLTNDTLVVFETFTLVERLAAADEGRYPVVELTVPLTDQEIAASDLYELDTVGIEELALAADRVTLRAGFSSDDAAARAERWVWANHPDWRPRFEVIVGDDWLDAWREHFTPVQVGSLLIVPDWDGARAEADDHTAEVQRLLLDPKRAWGTGAHASTALVLGALQSPSLSLDGARVLDVGCGSGILAIAALLLGASTARGIDVDRSAIAVTTENARRNGVADRCSAEWVPLDAITETFDVVCANILAPVLIEMAGDLQRVTTEGGTILLAGLIDEQLDSVLCAFDRCESVEIRTDDAWRGIVLRRASA